VRVFVIFPSSQCNTRHSLEPSFQPLPAALYQSNFVPLVTNFQGSYLPSPAIKPETDPMTPEQMAHFSNPAPDSIPSHGALPNQSSLGLSGSIFVCLNVCQVSKGSQPVVSILIICA
uniref:Uncharacterized protein n=1 Tax=Podarcis muralis TaxID=64176 RepID=A0A670IKW4_PODMU